MSWLAGYEDSGVGARCQRTGWRLLVLAGVSYSQRNIGWLSGSSPVLLSLDPSHCHQTYLPKTKTQSWPVGVEGPVFLLSHISSSISECFLLLSDQIVSSWAQDQCCFGSLPQDWHSCSRNPHGLQSLKYSLWLFMEKVGFYRRRQQLRSVPSWPSRSQDYGWNSWSFPRNTVTEG